MPFQKGQSGNPNGKKKGTPNKKNKLIQDMIIEALNNKGGAEYLQKQADKNPTAFMTLIGKTLPLQVTGADGDDFKVNVKVSFE